MTNFISPDMTKLATDRVCRYFTTPRITVLPHLVVYLTKSKYQKKYFTSTDVTGLYQTMGHCSLHTPTRARTRYMYFLCSLPHTAAITRSGVSVLCALTWRRTTKTTTDILVFPFSRLLNEIESTPTSLDVPCLSVNQQIANRLQLKQTFKYRLR